MVLCGQTTSLWRAFHFFEKMLPSVQYLSPCNPFRALEAVSGNSMTPTHNDAEIWLIFRVIQGKEG
jgi:hypothetical protein